MPFMNHKLSKNVYIEKIRSVVQIVMSQENLPVGIPNWHALLWYASIPHCLQSSSFMTTVTLGKEMAMTICFGTFILSFLLISCCVMWRWLHLPIRLLTADTITALLDFHMLGKLGRKESPRSTVSVFWHSNVRFRNGFDSRASPASRASEVLIVHYDQCLVQIWRRGECLFSNCNFTWYHLPSLIYLKRIWELDFIYTGCHRRKCQ
jgi:hypothetical protein